MKNFFILLICLVSANMLFGQTLKSFSLPDAATGNTVSLADFASAKGVVIIFTSNYCPYSKLYDDRIDGLVNEFSGKGIQFVLVNPNSKYHPEYESLEAMKEKAIERGYAIPYVSDPDQTLSKALGATRTPEAFVLKKAGGEYRVVYKGALDDNPQRATDVAEAFLNKAIQAQLDGKPGPTNQRTTGCLIKKG